MWHARPRWFEARKAGWIENLATDSNGIDAGSSKSVIFSEELENCNVVTSKVGYSDDLHQPVIDIDFSAVLIESSSLDHYHLYLNQLVDWEDYKELLLAMAKCGIIEQGYADSSIDKGYTAVRLPWVHK